MNNSQSPMDEGRMQQMPAFSMGTEFNPDMLRQQLAKQIRSGIIGTASAPQPPMKPNKVLNLKDRFRRKKFNESRGKPMGVAEYAALTMFDSPAGTSADTSQLYRQG